MHLKRKGVAILNSIIVMLSIIFLGSITAKALILRGEMLGLPSNTNTLYEVNNKVTSTIDLINDNFSNEELNEIIISGAEEKKGKLKLNFIKDENKFELENTDYREKFRFRYEEMIPCKCTRENCNVSKSPRIIIKPDIEVIYD